MVKKQVPDWLNSSLWSTAPPPPPSPTPQAPSPPQPSLPPDDEVYNRPTRSSSAASSTDFPVGSSVPVAPPAVTKPPEPVKAEIRDPLRGSDSVSDHEYNGSSTSSSVEDISRQAQLLQEVISSSFSNLCSALLLISFFLLNFLRLGKTVKIS